MSGAVGRVLLRNILHEGHSLSISQDFPWVKTSHLFFPVHECLMCIPGSFLLLMWQQERWHGWRGLTLDSVCAQLLSLVWLCDPMDCGLPGWSVHGDSLGKNNGVGLHALLQGIFPTQGLNWSLLHFRQVLYHLSQGWTDNRDLFPVLFLQFILLPCANDILFSLFSVDETVNFLGCLDCYNKIPQIGWEKNGISFSHLWSWSLEVRGLVWLGEGSPPGHKLLLVI